MIDTTEKSVGLGLNVWQDGDRWWMSLYYDSDWGTDTQQRIQIDVTRARLHRYFKLSEDEDWWTYDPAELQYIIFGTER
jgi:hypothetical protein